MTRFPCRGDTSRGHLSGKTAGAITATLSALLLVVSPGLAVAEDDRVARPTIRAVLELVAEGLEQPVLVTDARDDSGRLFIPEKRGRIRVIAADGRLLPEPFLDIVDRTESRRGEQGLLGLAFHPEHDKNGRFYVFYTREPDGATVVSEFVAQGDRADASSERPIVVTPQPGSSINGGMIAFDSSGLLVLSLGDGAFYSRGRPGDWDPESPYGKIMRFDVDAVTDGVTDGSDLEVLAVGLRNPWRFSIDRASGDIYIGDVGLWSWEEINVLPAGGPVLDFGWSRLEGPQCGPAATCDPGSFTPPSLAYPHAPHGAVIGGYAYRGTAEPLLDGLYIFGDFALAKLFAVPLESLLAGAAVAFELHDRVPGSVQSLGEDEAGELYVVSVSSVFRLSAERYDAPVEPSAPELPAFPVRAAGAIQIQDVSITKATGATLLATAPHVSSTNDLVIEATTETCITVDPTGSDPFLVMPVPNGSGLRVEPHAEGEMQVFLEVDGSITQEQSTIVDVEAIAYEVFAPPRSDDDHSVIRIDPPGGSPTTICSVLAG